MNGMTFVMLLYCGLLQFWKHWTPPFLSPWFPQHQALLVPFQTCRAWDLGYRLLSVSILCYLYLIYTTCSRNIRLFSQAAMSFQMSVPLSLLIHLPELSSLIFLLTLVSEFTFHVPSLGELSSYCVPPYWLPTPLCLLVHCLCPNS